MDNIIYLGVMISTEGGMGDEVAHRLLEGRKVWGAMAKLEEEYDTQRSKTGVI